MNAPATIRATLEQATTILANSDSPRLDAELLLCSVLDKPRSHLHTWPDKILDHETQTAYRILIERRAKGEPVAYILGQQDFWTHTLKVSPAVLIPRPETELLVETALQHIPEDAHWDIADLGTGSGAIALAIASERPECTVYASDICEEALAIAIENAKLLRINNVVFKQGSWLEPFAEMQFELIASNPPYIAEGDPHLENDVLKHEPKKALTSHENGLHDIDQIAKQAVAHLKPGSILIFEHGWQQAADVQKILKNYRYQNIRTARDMNQHGRVTYGLHGSQTD